MALIICTKCHTQIVADRGDKCPVCGTRIPGSRKRFWILVAAIPIVAVLLVLVSEHYQERRRLAEVEEKSAYRLEEAKKEIAKKNFVEAGKHLQYMSRASKAWNTEGKALWDEYSKIIKSEEAAEIGAKRMRQQFASEFEKKFLSDGIDAHVKTGGEKDTALLITCFLVGRPFVFKFSNDEKLLQTLSIFGFKRVVFSDGRNFLDEIGVPDITAWGDLPKRTPKKPNK